MPSGLRVDTDAWIQDFQDAKQLADEIIASIQERNTKHRSGGSEASRMTAAARRKLGILGTRIDQMSEQLNSRELAHITENEKNRRRDLLSVLKSRKEQMMGMLSRNQANRESLLEKSGFAGSSSQPQETERTAELDNQGLLQLQQQVMQEQDSELDELSHSVQNTKHIALAINEELDLQNSLLDEFQEDVEVTSSRLKAARRRVAQVLKKSNNCKCFMLMLLLVMLLMLVLGIGFKFVHA
uniref:Syntaxin 8 n=1 Tax=Tetraselmis sp. GSL018 TaxID=582737 RepID=A0A061RCK1_9CHLO